jgi:DNA-directed RNA polymerase II subunit RPB1
MKIKAEFAFEEDENTTQDNKRDLTPEQCLKILGMISDEDCRFLGFDCISAKPEWLIISRLPVAPPPVRPSVSMGSNIRQEDDLTHQYQQILKANNQLKSHLNTANHIINENSQLLQFYCATLIDNEQAGNMVSRHKSGGKAIKAIRSRLKGKEGRLRGNLMGKRVDFSARTVITCDPTLDLDQLGVPRSIAENITIPEVVTPQNIDEMRKLVFNGPTTWPGAKYIKGEGGKMIDLNYARTTETFIDYGYVIERHLRNDDYVLFNRQPSLHKMSIMGHRVKVLPYSTFRLNLSVTAPYNADFDGDEMNMFVPQSLETKAEVKEIMHIPKQIISPQSNSPVMGIVQDTLAGILMFTYRDTFIELDLVMGLLMWIEDFDGKIPPPAILKPKPLWTGKQILSLILPNFNLVKDRAEIVGDEWNDPRDNKVIIKKGELISGIICKKTVGTSHGGIVHVIYNELGPDFAKDFLSRAQRLVNNWLVTYSHSVGVQDTIAESKVLEEIAITLQKAKEKVKIKLLKAQDGRLKCQPGKDMLETFEAKVNKTLNDARNEAGKLARNSLDISNKIILMVLAGSKGNDNNISQIMACVGQQNVEGKRIPFGFNRRTLPHFGRDDYGPESRGFVENSYLRGLTPQEFYFHAMGGREGLIDTAVKTSETGYIQRRLEKALEDVMVKYDGTVRNSMEHIIQFLYGEDGMAGEKLEGMKIPLLDMDDKKLKNKCAFNPHENAQLKSEIREFMTPENAEDVLNNPEVSFLNSNLNPNHNLDRSNFTDKRVR